MQQTRGTAPGWVAWALRACAVAVIVACSAAWLAVDRAHRADVARAEATDAAVHATIDLGTAAAALASQLQSSLDALTVSSGSTAEAISHTVSISESLRAVVGVVAAGNVSTAEADQLETVTNNLGDLEASLLESAGGVTETQQALTDAQPLVAAAATTLRALPDDLRASSNLRSRADDGRAWWRLAIVVIGAVLLIMSAALSTMVRRADGPTPGQPTPGQP